MKRLTLAIAAGALGLLLASSAHAGLMSLLASQNTADDTIQDQSWGYIVPVGDPGGNDDIVVGLARINKVNSVDVSPSNTVWLVFSATQNGTVGVSDPFAGSYSGYTKHTTTTVSGSTLTDLLGVSVTNGAVVSVIELAASPSSGTYLAGLLDNTFATPTDVSGAITDIKTALTGGTAKHLFDIGFSTNNTDNFLYVEPVSPPVGGKTVSSVEEVARLDVIGVAPGLNLSDFKGILEAPAVGPSTNIAYTAGISIDGTVYFEFDTSGALTGRVRDDVDYIVNYVPEPGSVIALLSLGAMGLGVTFFRRRRNKA